VSLDELLGGDSESTYDAVLADGHAIDPDAELADRETSRFLEHALESLPERQRRVLELRYGLDGGAPRTIDAVASELGVGGEQVRRIEVGTLRRLAALRETHELRDAA
jgi:RNA polymerase sigma factor (sigma-70 family)